jgi:hypothetical protein
MLQRKALKQTSHPYPPSLNVAEDICVSIFSKSLPLVASGVAVTDPIK